MNVPNSKIISMLFRHLFSREKSRTDSNVRSKRMAVQWISLSYFQPCHTFQTPMFQVVYFIFFFSLASTPLFIVCVLVCSMHLFYTQKLIQNDEKTWIVSIEKRRQNPFAFTRTNHTGENIPTEMATGYYREFMKTTFRSESTLNIHSETFFSRSTAQQTNPLGNKSLASVFMCSVSSIFICVLFVCFFFLSRPF